MLELQNLSFEVPETENGSDTIAVRSIISDISFTFESSRIYAVTGPNGSGKSTLAKLIMGIHAPSRGTIRFMDEDITRMAIDERSRAGIAYGFQHPALKALHPDAELTHEASIGKIANDQLMKRLRVKHWLQSINNYCRTFTVAIHGDAILKRIGP